MGGGERQGEGRDHEHGLQLQSSFWVLDVYVGLTLGIF